MPRESLAHKRQRATEVCQRLTSYYPDAECALHYQNPFTLTIAVMLSAQTTDAAVNKVTPVLFEKWPDAYALAQADLEELEDTIKTIGFWRSKATHAQQAAQMIVSEFSGQVPDTMEELTRLPGVGRKTDNIVLNLAFGHVEGIAVDTHVYRIATRLKFTKAPTPLKAEQDLLKVIPEELWGPLNHTWVLFGRDICHARGPECERCPLTDLCPSAFSFGCKSKKK